MEGGALPGGAAAKDPPSYLIANRIAAGKLAFKAKIGDPFVFSSSSSSRAGTMHNRASSDRRPKAVTTLLQ